MGKTKKPRKKYIPKLIAYAYGYGKEEIEHIRGLWQDIGIKAYVKLPAGNAERDDILCLRDLFNVCLVSLCVRTDMSKESILEARTEIRKAGAATFEIFSRGEATNRYIAKGDELVVINEMVKVCLDYVNQSLTNCPMEFMREWATLKWIQTKMPPEKLIDGISVQTVRKVYFEMTPDRFRRLCCKGFL